MRNYATKLLRSEEWTFLSCYLRRGVARVMIDKIPPEIKPEWLIVNIVPILAKSEEQLSTEQVIRTQQINWCDYGQEITF